MSLFKLFLIFVKIGAILLGGGYVIFPIIQNEFIKKLHIIEQEELVNYFALSQSLPGIIAANMAMFIGYKLKGTLGAVSAMFGIIFVPFLCIIILVSVLGNLADNNHIQGAFWGISIAVIALIILTAREMWQKSNKDLFFYIIFIFSLLALLVLKMSPSTTIAVFAIFGVLIKYIRRRYKK